MAKAILLRALKDMFGNFVDGLSADHLQVAVWNGEVVLDNLSLKPSVLDGLDLPLSVVMGSVSKLSISVPWTRLGSEPVRVTIDGIYALGILKEHSSPAAVGSAASAAASDALALATNVVLRRQLREKRRKLRWAQLNEESDGVEGQEQLEEGFWGRLLGKIVDNLVVNISNLHVRIEDPNQWSGRSFAFGFSLRKFTSTTCDAHGQPVFVDRFESSGGALHRRVTCTDLALYLDSDAPQLSVGDLTDARRDMEYLEFEDSSPQHDYLLSPCSPAVMVTKNDQPSLAVPRWALAVNLGGIHVRFTRQQFQDAMGTLLAMERHLMSMRPNPRPAARPSRHPRAWWRYAIARVIADERRRKETAGWVALSRRLLDREKYIALYKRTRTAPFLVPLSDAERAELQRLEDALPLDAVLTFRATALAQLAVQRSRAPAAGTSAPAAQANRGAAAGGGVGSWVRSWVSSAPAAVNAPALSAEERAEIENAIEFFDAGAREAAVPDATLNVVVTAKLKDATLTLVDALGRELLHALVEGESRVETCVGPTWRTTFALDSFELTDRFTRDTLFPSLVAPRVDRNDKAAPHVLHVTVEVKPAGRREDVAVEMTVVPFRIVLVPQWVGAVSGFFVVSEEMRLGAGGLPTDALFEWSEDKQQDLVEALARRTLIALRVHVAQPIIALPLVASRHTLPMVILDLGDLVLVSDDPRLKGNAAASAGGGIDDSDVGLALDAWQLNLNRVRARLVTQDTVASGAWQRVFDDGAAENAGGGGYFPLLDEFDLSAQLAICVTPEVLQVAKTRLQLSATALKLHAPPSLLEYAADLGVSWSTVLAGSVASTASAAPPQALARGPNDDDAPAATAATAAATAADAGDVGGAEKPALLQVTVDVDALVVTFTRADAQPLARVDLRRFHAQQVRKPTGEAAMVLSLGSAQVFDLFSATPPLMASSLASHASSAFDEGDNGATALISVDVKWSLDSTAVVCSFDRLHVNWNPETIAEISEAYSREPSAAPPPPAQLLKKTSSSTSALSTAATKAAAAPRRRKTLQFAASMNSLSAALCKGASGRVLAVVSVASTTVGVQQDSGRHTWFKAKLGQMRTTMPHAGASDFVLFNAGGARGEQAMFTIDFTTKVDDDIHDAMLACTIGHARLTYSQQMWMELVDYINEGVLGAIFLDLTERVDEVVVASRKSAARWLASLAWAAPVVVLPTVALGFGDEHVRLTCSAIEAHNSFTPPTSASKGKWSMLTKVHMSDAAVEGALGAKLTALLVDPVRVELNVTQPVGADEASFRRDVAGTVSAIEIELPREQYYLLHRVLNGNLLSEPPAAIALAHAPPASPRTERVLYEYDKTDVPSTPFHVDVEFSIASLKLVDDFPVATFALKQAVVSIDRPEPGGVLTNTLRVMYLDLVDDRPVSRARCFRHLILCDNSSDTEQPAFEVVYVGERAQVSIDLHTFRSAVMLDLFWSVLDFVTTTSPPARRADDGADDDAALLLLDLDLDDDDDALAAAPAAPAAAPVVLWKGTFKLRRASMILLCDLTNPASEAIVVGGDLDLEWQRKEAGKTSTWGGALRGFELYRATFPLAVCEATAEQSRVAMLQPVVGSQVVEPADTSFSYTYEQDQGVDSKFHNRHVAVRMEQMEMFLSITDLATMLAIGKGLGRGDGPAPLKGYDFFRPAGNVKMWRGLRSDMPLNDPTPVSTAYARRRLGKQRFTIEALSQELRGIELVERDGFVTVSSVPRTSAVAQLLMPGDVVVAVDFTPVLQKSPRVVRALLDEALSDAQSTMTVHPGGCQEPLVLKDTLEVNGGVAVLHLIDDIHGRDLPLGHLSFSKVDVFVNGSNEGNYVSGAGLLLAMHYHDSITGRWEMLMSPWDASLSCLWQPHGQIECSFETSKDLQFQLSDVFVRASADAVRRAQSHFDWNSLPNVKPSHKPSTEAFVLRNRTGEPVTFWLGDDDAARTRVAPGDADVSFAFAHQRGEGKGPRREYTRPRVVHIEVGDGGINNPLPPVVVNTVHRGFVQLVPRLAPAELRATHTRGLVKVMWEVALEDGRLVLELRSFRRVRNLLSVPVAVIGRNHVAAGAAASGSSGKETCIVQIGEIVALPIGLGDVTEILLRPLTAEELGWSEPCYVELAAQRGTSHVMCKPVSPVHEPFYLHVRAEIEEEDGVSVRFTIYPPVVVCNQLPSPLALAVFGGERRIAAYPVAPGAALNVHDLPVQGSKSFVSFRLPNSEWTRRVRVDVKKVVLSTPRLDAKPGVEGVESGGKREEMVTMNVRDGDGTVVPISIVQQTTLHEGVKFIVFCAVWLVNKTTLPLAYGYANHWTSTSAGTSAPAGVMLYGPVAEDSGAGGKLQIKLPEGRPSLPIAVSVPDGKARVVVVPGGATWPNSFDLAVSVDVGPGVLFRTNIVTLAPRYMFSNLLTGGVTLMVRQIWDDVRPPRDAPNQRVALPATLAVAAGAKEPFWASSSTSRRPFRMQMSLATDDAWTTTWSEPFFVEKLLEGRAVVLVTLERSTDRTAVRFNVEVREDLIAGSIGVEVVDWVANDELPAEASELVAESGEAMDAKPVFEMPKTKFTMRIPSVVVQLRSDRASKHRTAPADTRVGQRRGAVGESREVGRAVVKRLEAVCSWRRDGENDYKLMLGDVSVLDPSPPGPLFRVPLEGSPSTEHDGFIDLHVVQRAHTSNMVFERLKLKVARLNIRVDERFVLDVARYAEDAVLKPLRGSEHVAVQPGKEEDCADFMRNLIESDRAMPLKPHSLGHLIFFDKFYVSPFEVKLWYQQSENDSPSNFVSFGVLSRLKIRILGQRIRFGALSLRRPFGSSNLYTGIVRAHYESEARAQMGSLLVKSINFSDAPFAIAESLLSKLVGSEIRSDEFKGESLSNEEFLVRYRRRLSSCQSSEGFLKDVVRNAVFDWSYNHTGLGSRRALLVGIVNRSHRNVTVRCQLARGGAAQLLPGGLASRQLGDDGVVVAATTDDGSWDPSCTSLLVAWGVLNDTVDVVLRSDAFTARFDHVKSVLHSEPGFTASYLGKEITSWLSWYCLVVDDVKE